MKSIAAKVTPAKPANQEMVTNWADPGYFAHQSRVKNLLRILKQLVVRPDGHKTLPTKSGIVLILLSLGIGSAAYNTASNILFIVLAMLLSSLLLSGLLSWMNFKGTRWRLSLERHFRAGDTTSVKIEVSNSKTFLPTYGLWFFLKAHKSEAARRLPLEERVDPAQSCTLIWLFEPLKRGREVIEIVGLESSFPFGFLRKSIGHSIKQEVKVWPRRISYEFTPPALAHARSAGLSASQAGSGSELINLRDYRSGDPLRQIHWKASARLQRFMIREVAEENHESYALAVETPASIWKAGEQFERLCSVVGAMAEDLFLSEQLRAVTINDGESIPIRKQGDLHAFLDSLAELQPVERLGHTHQHAGSTTITFSPGAGEHILIHVGGIHAGTA
ncbi:MAG: DUF58 domain-containing protein [Verrucomicrobiota bacterium]|nr:DUF58 domain-containing protein [Verrucomicrobiota bacterium]